MGASQTGVVVGLHMLVDLQSDGGALMRGVSSERLATPHPFYPGQFVMGGGWVGRVDSIRHDVRFSTLSQALRKWRESVGVTTPITHVLRARRT